MRWGWPVLAILLLVAAAAGWYLLRLAPPAAERQLSEESRGTTAVLPGTAPDASVGTLPASEPPALPGRDAERPRPRRASDEELRKQLPPGAVLFE
jgi:hypothetical protein